MSNSRNHMMNVTSTNNYSAKHFQPISTHIQEFHVQGAEHRHYPARGGTVVIVERIPRFLLSKGMGGGRESLRRMINDHMHSNPKFVQTIQIRNDH
jgi:hypothetical protein